MEYTKMTDGHREVVYDLEKCLKSIRIRNEDNERTIQSLSNEIQRIKSETFKDEELSKMRDDLENLKGDVLRGFPISEEEETKIKDWKRQHERETKSNLGCGGGRYKYIFTPTSIGTIGVIECSCGKRFVFQNIE